MIASTSIRNQHKLIAMEATALRFKTGLILTMPLKVVFKIYIVVFKTSRIVIVAIETSFKRNLVSVLTSIATSLSPRVTIYTFTIEVILVNSVFLY